MKRISSVRIKHILDENPDTSFLGEYTDDIEDGVIIRNESEFYEKLIKANPDYEPPEKGRQFRAFRPPENGEAVGTKNYYKYGMQDYQRMESLERGNWQFIGIKAEAQTEVSSDGGKTWKIDHITSGGLWGVESDSGKENLKEIEAEELNALKDILKEYGFTKTQIKKAFDNVEEAAN